MRAAPFPAIEMDTPEQVGGDPGSCRVAHPTELERQLDVARGGEPRQQSRLLEDERHVTVDVGPASRRLLEAGEEVEQRALPDPEAPTMQTNSPRWTSRLTPCN